MDATAALKICIMLLKILRLYLSDQIHIGLAGMCNSDTCWEKKKYIIG